MRETVKKPTLLNLVVVLPTIWQFCSPHLKTGSLGRPWKQQGCASAQMCSAGLCAVSLRAVLLSGRGRSAGGGAVPGLGSVPGPGSVPGAAGSGGGSAARGEARAAYPGAWHRRGAPGTACLSTGRGHSRQPLLPRTSSVLAGVQCALIQVLLSRSIPLLWWVQA